MIDVCYYDYTRQEEEENFICRRNARPEQIPIQGDNVVFNDLIYKVVGRVLVDDGEGATEWHIWLDPKGKVAR